MNIGLFAAEEIGLEVVSCFVEKREPIQFLALDRKDKTKVNEKILALESCDKIFYNDELYSEVVLSQLMKLEIDLILLAWWPYIIRNPLFQISKRGFLNMHPSYLPYNRGKHYYFWNIVEDVPFGVTLHLINDKIDSGEIVFQKEIETTIKDTGFTLRERAKTEMMSLFKEKFDSIVAGSLPLGKQVDDSARYHKGDDLEKGSEICLSKQYSGRELINILRGRSGFTNGGAWFQEGEDKYEMNLQIRTKSDG